MNQLNADNRKQLNKSSLSSSSSTVSLYENGDEQVEIEERRLNDSDLYLDFTINASDLVHCINNSHMKNLI